MKKIISLFKRNYDGNYLVRDEIVSGAEWVTKEEGIATRKFDGTCCLIKDGLLYKRYDCKKGKTPPIGFISAQEPDPITGQCPGWLAVGDSSEDTWHREAFNKSNLKKDDGTYELCGPKIQGNPEKFIEHELVKHGSIVLQAVPRTFEELKTYLSVTDIEGIVWHHPDGRMVKIKAKDFGLKRINSN